MQSMSTVATELHYSQYQSQVLIGIHAQSIPIRLGKLASCISKLIKVLLQEIPQFCS